MASAVVTVDFLKKNRNILWPKRTISVRRNQYVDTIFNNFENANDKVKNVKEILESAKRETDKTLSNVKDAIASAASIASASHISEEDGNCVVSYHEVVLKEIDKLDQVSKKLNQTFQDEITATEIMIKEINNFIVFSNAGELNIGEIEIEHLSSFKVPVAYNTKAYFEAISNLNSFKTVSAIVTGGLSIGSLFSSSTARKAVGVATGILAIGVAILDTMEKYKKIKSECEEIVKCMRKNSKGITENVNSINAMIEKIRAIDSIRSFTFEYFNSTIKSVRENPLHYLPVVNFDIGKAFLTDDVVESLNKISETFTSIANRKYLDNPINAKLQIKEVKQIESK